MAQFDESLEGITGTTDQPQPSASKTSGKRSKASQNIPTDESQLAMIEQNRIELAETDNEVLQAGLKAVSSAAGNITALNEATSDAVADLYRAAPAQLASMISQKLKTLPKNEPLKAATKPDLSGFKAITADFMKGVKRK